MVQSMVSRLRTVLSSHPSIRRRLCWLLGGVGLGMLLAINLVWLPGAMHDIHEAQAELQRVAVRVCETKSTCSCRTRKMPLRVRPSFSGPFSSCRIRKATPPHPALLPTRVGLRRAWHPRCGGEGAAESLTLPGAHRPGPRPCFCLRALSGGHATPALLGAGHDH